METGRQPRPQRFREAHPRRGRRRAPIALPHVRRDRVLRAAQLARDAFHDAPPERVKLHLAGDVIRRSQGGPLHGEGTGKGWGSSVMRRPPAGDSGGGSNSSCRQGVNFSCRPTLRLEYARRGMPQVGSMCNEGLRGLVKKCVNGRQAAAFWVGGTAGTSMPST